MDLAEAPEEGGEFKAEGPKPQGPGPGEALGEEPLQGHAFRVLAEKPPPAGTRRSTRLAFSASASGRTPSGAEAASSRTAPAKPSPLRQGRKASHPSSMATGWRKRGRRALVTWARRRSKKPPPPRWR